MPLLAALNVIERVSALVAEATPPRIIGGIGELSRK